MSTPLIAAIEAGGTKFNCAIAKLDGQILESARIQTENPSLTLRDCMAFLRSSEETLGRISAMGIGSFGPLNLDPGSVTYGSIFSTPKQGWSGTDLSGFFSGQLGVPVVIDTDVNCAALAEGMYGAAQHCSTYCYITVGTGIGVGIVINGKAISQKAHPEAGHIRVPRAPEDQYAGCCTYHADCLEGLACGPAIAERWGEVAEKLPEGHPAWKMEAYYIAALCNNLIYSIRPERIILGGGVLGRKSLYGSIHQQLHKMLGGYALGKAEMDIERLVCAPGLAETPPGLLGAIELARQAYKGDEASGGVCVS